MKTVAFIFARGGSKGLPEKNIKKLCGKPLLEYSIDVAKEIKEIDDIFVSTDCSTIAMIAKNNGAKIIKRPDALATDLSPELSSWKHAINYVKENYYAFDTMVSLPTTSPLRSKQDVTMVIDKLNSTNADICITVTPSSRSPYFNMVKFTENNLVELVISPENLVIRRQDAPEVFDVTTLAYAARVSYIEHTNSLFSGKVAAKIVPKERSIDIDDIYDFIFAEALLNFRDNNESS